MASTCFQDPEHVSVASALVTMEAYTFAILRGSRREEV
jgi:hypothetical protein